MLHSYNSYATVVPFFCSRVTPGYARDLQHYATPTTYKDYELINVVKKLTQNLIYTRTQEHYKGIHACSITVQYKSNNKYIKICCWVNSRYQ